MNLHGTVRGAIGSVNPDVPVQWLVSTGPTVSQAGVVTPAWDTINGLRGQVQAVSGEDLRKYAFLQGQGIYRAVYLYGNALGISRVDVKGGDMLKFPQSQAPGTPVQTWLVRQVTETWTSDATQGGWCRVLVSLQLDPNNPTQ